MIIVHQDIYRTSGASYPYSLHFLTNGWLMYNKYYIIYHIFKSFYCMVFKLLVSKEPKNNSPKISDVYVISCMLCLKNIKLEMIKTVIIGFGHSINGEANYSNDIEFLKRHYTLDLFCVFLLL